MDFQSVGQNLRNDLIHNITKAYWSELVSSVRSTEFWNQCNVGMILVPLHNVVVEKKIPNALQDILSNNIPVLLVENVVKPSGPRALVEPRLAKATKISSSAGMELRRTFSSSVMMGETSSTF